MNRNEGNELYLKAQKLALRDYREKMLAGQSPFLPVLDDILQNVPVENQIPLGQVDIPLNLLVGTKTTGRTAAFASNFMPLLDLKTEFASKWVNLCLSHLEEGIRDPIRCYEYMGRFYVQEGNKRVSVLKYFDATSILGNVIRVVPQYSDDPAVQMYYEFMHFYPITQNYLLTFTKPGSYARLQKILGKGPDEKWSGDDRAEVLSLYNWVEKAFLAHGGAKLRCTVGDVLLLLLRVYTKEELAKLSPNELSEKLDALWDDVLALQKADPVRVSDKPAEPKQTGLLDRILPGKHTAPSHLKVAFVHERTPGTSSWTSQHEFGRTQLDTVFAGQVETTAYFNAVPGENADALVEQAIADGADEVNSIDSTDKTYDMFSAPVMTNETYETTVPTNGNAMAAYMMSVGLWVSGLAFCVMLSPYHQKIGARKPGKAWLLTLGKLWALGLLQAVLMILCLSWINDFQPEYMGKTLIIACLASVAFLTLEYCVNFFLDIIGDFILLVFMVLQLSGCAGTYPLELSDKFYQVLNPFMPRFPQRHRIRSGHHHRLRGTGSDRCRIRRSPAGWFPQACEEGTGV